MRETMLAVAAVLMLSSSAYSDTPAGAVTNSSYVTSSGVRVLRQEVVIPASADSVWWAFTTAAGMKSWMVPVASIDLRVNGAIETSYDQGAKLGNPDNIHNTVLSYIPDRLFSFKIGLTAQFPEVPRRAGTLFYVILLEDAGAGQTRVKGSMLGWGEGEQWNEVYKKFEWGNEYTFRQLYRRFTEGPTKWESQVAPTTDK